MNQQEFRKSIADFINSNTPFVFILDFKCNKPFVCSLEEAADKGILYNIKGQSNYSKYDSSNIKPKLNIEPISFQQYSQAFKTVIDNIKNGNTYLLNLTFPTKIESNLNLQEIFEIAKAPYKIYKEDAFISFSPECFVRIEGDYIYSYPMKGTIDASIKYAKEVLLNDDKEIWEHNTIVDLIRNDLAMVSKDIEITKYRYIEKIKTNRNEIYQTSSEIRGKLPKNWKQNLADIILRLLPAGSISGAPKQKTVEIIEAVETMPRNYYTGVFGVFDGNSLDTAVCIRYIENIEGKLYYKSGGGITFMSDAEKEYQELRDKIYVPTI